MRDDCDGSAIALRAAWRRLLQCAKRGHSTNRLIIAADRPIYNLMIENQPALDGLGEDAGAIGTGPVVVVLDQLELAQWRQRGSSRRAV